jgi:hypothetical protein
VRLSAVIQPPASISYFLFPISGNPAAAAHGRCHAKAIQLHMPYAIGHWAQLPMQMACAAGAGPHPMRHVPRLKAGGLVGLRGTIRFKLVEVFLEALSAFVYCVRSSVSQQDSVQVSGHY